MEINNLTNFVYKMVPSTISGRKKVQVVFKYRDNNIIRFYYIPEKPNLNYINEAKKLINEELNSGYLYEYARWFWKKVYGFRPKKIVVGTILLAAVVGICIWLGIRCTSVNPQPAPVPDPETWTVEFVKNNTKLVDDSTGEEVINQKIEKGAHFEGTISTTSEDYDLPDEIYVTSGDQVLTQDEDYTYNMDTGKFTTDVTSDLKIQLTPSCNVTSFVFDYPSHYHSIDTSSPGFRVVFEDGEESGYVEWGTGAEDQLSPGTFVSHDYRAEGAPLQKYTVKIHGKIKLVLFNNVPWSAEPVANQFITDVYYGNHISTLNIDEPSNVSFYRVQSVVFDKNSPITEIKFHCYHREIQMMNLLVLPINATTISDNGIAGGIIDSFVDLKCYSKVPYPGYFTKEITGHIYVPFGSEDAYKAAIAESAYPQMASLVTGFNDILD